ncbi:MAG: AMP-binding protein, partial [bacterium]|nr:AMP-binding protein [bacterium]
TSGTTGRPKGISMVHRVLTNLTAWQLRSTAPDAGVRTPQFAPLSFDIIFQETFSTLCSGGTLVLLTEEERRDAVLLVDRLERHRIERLYLPFIALQQLCEVASDSPPRALREVITAGEQLQVSRSLERFFTKAACTLENQYGPSECHVVTYYPLRGAPREWTALPPIGRGIGNFRIYLLDSRLRPVSVGVPGEVCLSGAGMARGYLKRPELTAGSFLPDPWTGEPGERLYRTGDLARFLADGNLEFMGRIDFQVKIRGFRIELGEIETVLGSHPGVRETVVVVREDAPGGHRQLVAYAVRTPEAELDASELRGFLAQSLPDYMVPQALVFLDSLPWTPGGKVDRKALPAPERRGPEEGYVAPANPTEDLLAGIWAAVLGFERVGVEENFFELGGHSLLATQVTSRVREVFGVELPVQRLFEAPTVARLAAVVEAAAGEARDRTVSPIRPLPREGGVPQDAVPLSFAQQRLWFIDQFEPGSAAYNLPRALRLGGRLELTVLARTLNEIVRRHEALRTNFANAGGRPVQVIAPALEPALPRVDLRELVPAAREEAARRLATGEARRPFDLSRDPLLRVTAVQLAREDHVILFTMHHIVSDGWSMGVLIRELTALYRAFSEGMASPLGELAVQYADYALWQRQWLTEEAVEEELGYWREQLAGVPRLELPTDRPRPVMQTFPGKLRGVALGAELSESLVRLSREQGVTLYMTLLAGFQTLLARYTGQEDIAVGSPIAGRNRREIEDLIGFFINTLVLRSDLSGDPSFGELLGRVRQVALEAYAHQELPFERLVEELEPERDLSSTPLFQVMFAVQNAPREGLEFPGLVLSPVAGEGGTEAKFELSLSLEESDAGLRGVLGYNTDLFDATTIARLLAHFELLLQGIVDDPPRPLSELPRMTAAEHHQLLVEWRGTGADDAPGRSIQELFEVRAKARPEAPALVCGRTVLSYRELEVRANRLAHHLRALGVAREAGAPESVVGLVAERRPEVVVGLLGILKAGGVYLPLDPSHPADRLAFQLDDADARVLLVQESAAGRLPGPEDHGAQVVYLDGAQAAAVDRQPAHEPGGCPGGGQMEGSPGGGQMEGSPGGGQMEGCPEPSSRRLRRIAVDRPPTPPRPRSGPPPPVSPRP